MDGSVGREVNVVRWVTVFDYERVVRYRRGRLVGVLGPGRHWLGGLGNSLRRVDLRERVLTMPLQELLTGDGVAVKVGLAASWRVDDPVTFVQSAETVQDALYLHLQLALRAPVAAVPVAEVVADRAAVSTAVLEAAGRSASAYGVRLVHVAVRDLTLPGELKSLFAEIVRARQESQAALERARGEAAALRSLANTAALLEAHPVLLHLRTLQVAESAGSPVLLSLPAST